jgi:hypothetical protein
MKAMISIHTKRLLLAFLFFSPYGFAQASDDLGFDITFMINCKLTDFEKHYELSFMAENRITIKECQYNITPVDSGISIRINGRYHYVVGGLETFGPVLVISQNNLWGNQDVFKNYFIQLIGFQGKQTFGFKTVIADIGTIALKPSEPFIMVYNGRPMVNANIYIRYNSEMDENKFRELQHKIPNTTKIKRK